MDSSIEKGREVIRIEAEAVAALTSKIDGNFAKAVDLIYQCKGRVIVTGMGKSGLVARKIVATMNSTGTSAIFLHPSDAVHGDLGMVRKEDVVICISKSGDTEEIREIIRGVAAQGVGIVLITAEIDELTSLCDRVLVMFRGSIVADLAGERIERGTILHASVSGEMAA